MSQRDHSIHHSPLSNDSRFFFIHGGPGLNSAPEKEQLLPHFLSRGYSNVFFWNEPSALRNSIPEEILQQPEYSTKTIDYYYSQLRKEFSQFAKDRPVTVFALSFGALGAMRLCEDFNQSIHHLYLISPATLLKATLRKIATTSLNLNHPNADVLQAALHRDENQVDLINNDFEIALQNAFQNPPLLTKYFYNPLRFQQTLQSWSQPQYAPDFMNLFSILKSLSRVTVEAFLPKNFSVPTTLILGKEDPFTLGDLEFQNIKSRNKMPTHLVWFDEASHYAHLDQPELFLNHLLECAV